MVAALLRLLLQVFPRMEVLFAMRSLVLMSLMAFVCAGLVGSDDVWAGKFGGGKSFGRSFKTTPGFSAVRPAPKTAPRPAGSPAGQTAPDKKRSFLGGAAGGILGGLLAGSLLGSLFGGAFSGMGGLTSILLMAALAFFAWRLFRRRSTATASAGSAAGYAPAGPTTPWGESPSQTVATRSGAFPGGALWGQGDAAPSAPATLNSHTDSEVPFEVPSDFDEEGFLDRARGHYRTLVAAWNAGDMRTIADYVSPELYQQLEQERSRAGTGADTEVLFVDAALVRACRSEGGHQVSVRFQGSLRDLSDRQEEEIMDIWHLEQAGPGAAWRIIGIEQASS